MLGIGPGVSKNRTMHMPMPLGRIKHAPGRGTHYKPAIDQTAPPPLSESARAALAILLAQAPPAPCYGVDMQCRTGASDSSR